MWFWIPILICWGLALAALYVHPAFWVVFGVALVWFVVRELRSWGSGSDPGGPDSLP